MNKEERAFVAVVWERYRQGGRHDLPWRKTINPYHIMVSEIMLQQTQVERVVPKYREFIKAFPSVRRLAAAPLGDILKYWQGLGYNRRAKFLREAAIFITEQLKGRFPKDESGLRSLPGVGSYTAAAIMAFAYNKPLPLIETNVRQVYLHHFFKDILEVRDAEIKKLVERTLSYENPREWYWALMDYGAQLKQVGGNINHRSKHYTKQSKFQGSNRQIRGAIIRLLAGAESPLTVKVIQALLGEHEPERVATQLACLVAEGLLVKNKSKYSLL